MKLVRKTAPPPSMAAEEGPSPWKVLVVDDEPDILTLTALNLKEFHFLGRGLALIKAASAAEAKQRLAAHPDIAVALIDVVMETDSAGLDLVRHIRDELGNRMIRLVIRTGQPGVAPERVVIDNFDIDDYKDKTELTAQKLYTTVRTALKAFRDLDTIAALNAELRAACEQLTEGMALASEYKDATTGSHIRRMSEYTRRLALALGMDAEQADSFASAALLHDVGKVGVPDAILNKPGRLTPEEFEIIKTHCEIGAAILSAMPMLALARDVALCHHEKWNGRGYPHGLAGTEISLVSRIVGVADVFDALTCRRPYKDPWPPGKAIEELIQGAGEQFDPAVVTAMVRLFREGQFTDLLNPMATSSEAGDTSRVREGV